MLSDFRCHAMRMNGLSVTQPAWLPALVDRLEAACWCLTTMPGEYARAASGWERAEDMLLYDAGALGCRDAVHGLLHDLKGGRW